MPGPTTATGRRLADAVRDRRTELLAPSAGALGGLDQLPAFLDALTALLDGDDSALGRIRGIAAQHGAGRAAVEADVTRVFEAYTRLREAVLDVAEASDLVPSIAEQRALARGLDAAFEEAGKAYAERRSREERRAGAALLSAVLEASPVGISVVDRALRYVHANSALAQINGVPASEMIGRTVRDVVPALADRIEPLYRRALDAGERILDGEVSGLTSGSGGQLRHWRVSYYPVRDERGEIVFAASVVQDVTERRRAELAQAQMQAVVQAAPARIALLDTELRYVQVNESLSTANGVAMSAHLGRTMREVLDDPTADLLEPILRRVLADGVPVRNFRFQGPDRRTDTWRGWRADFFPVRGDDGRVLGIGGIVNDTTEEDRARAVLEQALRDRARAVDVLEHGDACVVMDRDWRILLVNAMQERLSGTRRADTLGRRFWDVFPEAAAPDSPFWSEYHRVMEERVEAEFEAYYAPRDLWSDVRAYPANEGGIAVFIRDATPRRRMQEVQEHLLGIVGHDLRNPLASVMMSAQAMLRPDATPERLRKLATRTLSSAERMARIINQLLDFSRARLGGGLALERQRTDLCALVVQTADEFASTHPGRVHVSCAADREVGRWDPDRLAQVVSNLVGNALAHGDPSVPVEVRTRSEPDAAILEVWNAGAVDAEVRDGLFDPFRRGGNPSSKGLGLGLYIVREVVQSHGGAIEVRSSEDAGTTFRVRLPRGDVSEAREVEAPSP